MSPTRLSGSSRIDRHSAVSAAMVENKGRRLPELPPPFRLVTLREVGDAFAYACAHAAELGAGTLVSIGRFDLAEFAVILEPEEPLASARLAFYGGMVALCDALAALAPPEKPITIEWPDAVRVDGGLVGGGRLAWPDRVEECDAPDWLVFGATIRTAFVSSAESGMHPLATALEEEGFDDSGSDRLLEAFARHLMVVIDRWQELGFATIAKEYISRLESENGTRREIVENGDLCLCDAGNIIEVRRLVPALEAPSWIDPETAGPRL
jgi:biotin-(acetyl-CoA carboxylase) ligase